MAEAEFSGAVGSQVDKPYVVAGIAAFNEEKTIGRVVLQALDRADKVVVCDDGSSDLTANIAERLGAVVIHHERNLGYGAAIRSLFKAAREFDADVLVTLDADGQHDPTEIPNVVKPVISGSADIVIGSRFVDKRSARSMPWYRKAGVKVITKLANGYSGENGVKDGQSGFRAYNRRAMESLVMYEDGMGISAEILIDAKKKKLRMCEVSSSCAYQNGVRTSTHNPVRHGVGVVASIARLVVEDKPLLTLGVPGAVCLVVGVVFGAWMLQLYAVEHHIVTNIALASIAFVLIGFFCISTAVTLYAIGRLAKRMNGKPH